jgi:hypothetical protein
MTITWSRSGHFNFIAGNTFSIMNSFNSPSRNLDQSSPYCDSFYKRPYANLPVKSTFTDFIIMWSSYGSKERHLEDLTLVSNQPLRQWFTLHKIQIQLLFGQEKPCFVHMH